MLTIKRITAVLMLLLVLGFATPQAFADPGEMQTPPGQVEAPPGQTDTPPGQIETPPSSAQGLGGLTAWVVFQMLAGWNIR